MTKRRSPRRVFNAVCAVGTLVCFALAAVGCRPTFVAADRARGGDASRVVPIASDAWPARDVGGLAPVVIWGERVVDPQIVNDVDAARAFATREIDPSSGAFLRILEPRERLLTERWALLLRGSDDEVSWATTNHLTTYTWHPGRLEPMPDPSDDAALNRWLATASFTQQYRWLQPLAPRESPSVGSSQGLSDHADEAPRGIVISLFPLDGHRHTEPITRRLREAGYLVLRSESLTYRPDERPSDEPASGESASGESSMGGSDPDDEPVWTPERTADWIHQVTADYSYAIDAALTDLYEREPQARGVPVVVVGYSLGGLFALPAAAALREFQPDSPLAAAVVVGGGANIKRILLESAATSGWTDVLGDLRTAPKAQRARVASEWLPAMPLDPHFAAAALQDVPMLFVHARDDGFVPAETGDVLWERAGRPDRWVWPSGHVWMFWSLHQIADEIVEWVDNAVAAASPSHALGGPPERGSSGASRGASADGTTDAIYSPSPAGTQPDR